MLKPDKPRGVPLSPMRLLESGIPLSLLYDLVLGPESDELLQEERPAPGEPLSAEDGRLVRLAQLLAHGADGAGDAV